MISRIRIYTLIVLIESLVLLAFWAWWTFPEILLFDIFRDMGVIELLQLLFLSAVGLSACLISRYRSSAVNHAYFDFTFCQFIGACCSLLIFRELDYYMTYFMEEAQFLYLWLALIACTVTYGLFNLKRIFKGIRAVFSTRSIWFLGAGAVLYLVLAQIVGTKQFRDIFYPHSINFSRRYIEESMELIGLLIVGFGMLELHLQIRRLLPVHAGEKTKDWTEEAWRSFASAAPNRPFGTAVPSARSALDQAAPYELMGGESFKKMQGARGGSQMTMEQQTLSSRPSEVTSSTVVLPERVTRQLEELVFVAQKFRRSNTSFSATVLFIGISLITALLWFGFILRENAIEQSTNRQMELLTRQYELQVEQYQNQTKRWKKKNPLPDFRFEQLRTAIRKDVEQEYNFANFFSREAHRSN